MKKLLLTTAISLALLSPSWGQSSMLNNDIDGKLYIKGDIGYIYNFGGDLNYSTEGKGTIGYGTTFGYDHNSGFGLSIDYLNYDKNHNIIFTPTYNLNFDDNWSMKFGFGIGFNLTPKGREAVNDGNGLAGGTGYDQIHDILNPSFSTGERKCFDKIAEDGNNFIERPRDFTSSDFETIDDDTLNNYFKTGTGMGKFYFNIQNVQQCFYNLLNPITPENPNNHGGFISFASIYDLFTLGLTDTNLLWYDIGEDEDKSDITTETMADNLNDGFVWYNYRLHKTNAEKSKEINFDGVKGHFGIKHFEPKHITNTNGHVLNLERPGEFTHNEQTDTDTYEYLDTGETYEFSDDDGWLLVHGISTGDSETTMATRLVISPQISVEYNNGLFHSSLNMRYLHALTESHLNAGPIAFYIGLGAGFNF
ncbi:MAG: hypothetical protein ACR2NY_01645 [Alphaproteobacteria bacterium]